MKTKIAGVALAAVIACGWASGAEAYYVSASWANGYVEDGSTSASISISNGTVYYNEEFSHQPNMNEPHAPSFPYEHDYASGLGEVTKLINRGSFEYVDADFYFSINLHVQAYQGVSYPDGTTTGTSRDDYEMFSSVLHLKQVSFETYDISVDSAFFPLSRLGYPNQSYYDMSPVPLPGAAPLFGVALFGLFAAGYSARRKRAA